MLKPDNIFIICVALIALYCFGPSWPTLQKPTVEMTSDIMGSKLVSTDALGRKTTCTADVMPGGTIVSRCY